MSPLTASPSSFYCVVLTTWTSFCLMLLFNRSPPSSTEINNFLYFYTHTHSRKAQQILTTTQKESDIMATICLERGHKWLWRCLCLHWQSPSKEGKFFFLVLTHQRWCLIWQTFWCSRVVRCFTAVVFLNIPVVFKNCKCRQGKCPQGSLVTHW